MWIGQTGDRPADAAEVHGIRAEVIKLPATKRVFVLRHARWVAERSFGWMTHFRRLVLQPQFGEVALDIGHRAGNAERLVSVLARSSKAHERPRERFWPSKVVVLVRGYGSFGDTVLGLPFAAFVTLLAHRFVTSMMQSRKRALEPEIC